MAMRYLIFLFLLVSSFRAVGQTTYVDMGVIMGSSNTNSPITGPAGGLAHTNKLYLMFIGSCGSPAVEPTSVVSNGQSLVWSKLGTQSFQSGSKRLTIYYAYGDFAEGTGLGATVTWGVAQSSRFMNVISIDGTKTGNNGLDAIRQWAIRTDEATAANPYAELPATPLTENVIAHIYGNAPTSYAYTIESGYFALRAHNVSQFPCGAFIHLNFYTNTQNDINPTITANAMNYGAVAIEIVPADFVEPGTSRRRIIQSN